MDNVMLEAAQKSHDAGIGAFLGPLTEANAGAGVGWVELYLGSSKKGVPISPVTAAELCRRDIVQNLSGKSF